MNGIEAEVARTRLSEARSATIIIQDQARELNSTPAEPASDLKNGLLRTCPAPAKTNATRSSPAAAETRRTPPPVLIVVEDDPNDFILLKRALWKTGATARVWWAHSPQEALSILATVEAFTSGICIVCDVRLIGENGLILLDQVKARKATCSVKFAVLTGMCDRATESHARAAGADAFFQKTPNPEELIGIAREIQKLARS